MSQFIILLFPWLTDWSFISVLRIARWPLASLWIKIYQRLRMTFWISHWLQWEQEIVVENKITILQTHLAFNQMDKNQFLFVCRFLDNNTQVAVNRPMWLSLRTVTTTRITRNGPRNRKNQRKRKRKRPQYLVECSINQSQPRQSLSMFGGRLSMKGESSL